MDQVLSDIPSYLLSALSATLTQTLILLGPLIILTLLMNLISTQNALLGYKFFSRTGYLIFFGWLGTAVHELGHAFFALIFAHKIKEIKLFTPKSANGTLGYVNHSYNKRSIYQRIGNFWIGIGPILFGTALLFLINLILFRVNFATLNTADYGTDALMTLPSLKLMAINTWAGMVAYFDVVFTGSGTAIWKILLMVYLSYSIGSSITLSKSDFKGAAGGFIFFIVILLLFNLGTLWIGDFTKTAFLQASRYLSAFYFLIILSMAINLVFVIILAGLNLIKSNLFQ
jgi:hypothetical protein